MKHAKLTREMWLCTYANIPECLRDKNCGLSWDEVYFIFTKGKYEIEN